MELRVDRLGRLACTDSGNVHDYYRREFSYDARGRLASYADKRYFVSDSTQESCPPPEIFCDPPPPWDYTWSTTTIRSVTFNPDNSGNRTDGSASLSNDRLSSMTDPYTAASYSFSYDAEGRRTAKTASGYSQTYGWNDLGQLTWVKTNGDSVAYGYDAAGRRVRKYRSSTGATAHYLWDGDNLLMELDGSGNRVRQYAYQAGIDRPVSVTISGTTYNYQLDEAGNVIALWNASNAKVATYTDDPYGYPLATGGSVTQPLRWKGREYDSETGLYYIRARYYDPTVGRFISEDPIGLEGGINPYTFADGEPVNHSDPSGLVELPAMVIVEHVIKIWSDNFLKRCARGGHCEEGDFDDLSAGFGDAILTIPGVGSKAREWLKINTVDQCSAAYSAGSWLAVLPGVARLAYAGLAQGISLTARTATEAYAAREALKDVFRAGLGKGFRAPNLIGKTEAQVISSAGRTNPFVNSYGASIAVAGARAGMGGGCG